MCKGLINLCPGMDGNDQIRNEKFSDFLFAWWNLWKFFAGVNGNHYISMEVGWNLQTFVGMVKLYTGERKQSKRGKAVYST